MSVRETHPRTLVEAFYSASAAFPDRIAVDDLTTVMTYRQLADRVDGLVETLQAAGVGRDIPIGLCSARTADLIVGMLAILKAGGAYLPLPPDYPVERLQAMAGQAQTPLVVTDESSAVIAGRIAPCVIRVDGEPAGSPTQAAPASPAPDSDWLAYLMFTSGSTGAPKGVLVEHGNVLSLLESCRVLFALDERHVWVMAHSYAFDFSVWEIWGALAHGGTLLIPPIEVVREPERFWDLCVQREVTVLNVTPSYFVQIVSAVEGRFPEGVLRYVVFGGEALLPAALGPWFDAFGADGPQLANMYGITETTVHATVHFVDEGFARGSASVIGKALPHLEVLLLDEHRRPVALGEVGEMFVCGSGVARGYHRQPGLTAERFVTDPGTGRRAYRSGDLARRGPDGSLEYLGRADAQLKVRGFRVEPGEIEACLLQYPGVRQAVVTQHTGESDGALIAYVVAAGPTDLSELRSFACARLPAFMVPSFLVQIDAIPVTANGKTDRAALPRPSVFGPAGAAAQEQHGTAARLARIWQEVLGLEAVGVDQDFFAIGGTSMSAMRVAKRCRSEGVPFKITDLYRYATIRRLAELADARSADPGA